MVNIPINKIIIFIEILKNSNFQKNKFFNFYFFEKYFIICPYEMQISLNINKK